MTYQEFSTSAKIPGIHRPVLFKGSVNIEVDQAHYLFSTSGSSGKKHYLHSLKSIENAVESFLKSHPLESSDRWWVSLSTRHVAGFSILARSFFGGLKKPFEKSFVLDVDLMKSEDITLLSLVPTQIFDIVSKKIEAPPHLKYVFVGGARLSDELFLKANNLGWPLVSCFGATETFAQFSSSKDNIDFTAYDGWEIKSNNQKELEVKGPSLFSYQIFEQAWL